MRRIRKHPTQNRAARVAQVVEHLLSKHEAQSSNPVPQKKKNLLTNTKKKVSKVKSERMTKEKD
jgi:hypothetical protein